MEKQWQLEEAETKFREMLEESDAHGPQIIVKNGVTVGVLLPFEHWRRLELMSNPDIKTVLLAPEPRIENLVLPRRRWRRRRARPSSGQENVSP